MDAARWRSQSPRTQKRQTSAIAGASEREERREKREERRDSWAETGMRGISVDKSTLSSFEIFLWLGNK
jgi:hypothetical protein